MITQTIEKPWYDEQEVSDFEQGHNLPELWGTPKQVKYARYIRQKFVANCDRCSDFTYEDQQLYATAMALDNAAEWIAGYKANANQNPLNALRAAPELIRANKARYEQQQAAAFAELLQGNQTAPDGRQTAQDALVSRMRLSGLYRSNLWATKRWDKEAAVPAICEGTPKQIGLARVIRWCMVIKLNRDLPLDVTHSAIWIEGFHSEYKAWAREQVARVS